MVSRSAGIRISCGLFVFYSSAEPCFALYGGIRFGSNLTVEDALDLGFDHIALCLGAGRPTIIDIPGNLAKGVRNGFRTF